MYCPRCSQPQVSEEMRFCARCGLPLSDVRALVAAGGVLAGGGGGAQAAQLSKGHRGMRKGVWLILAALPVALVAGLLTLIDDDLAPLILLSLLCLLAGFARLLYGTFLEDRVARRKQAALQQRQAASYDPAQVAAAGRDAYLPPAQHAPPVDFNPRRAKTAEMRHPPSVTENTTTLLESEPDSPRG